MGSDWLQRFNKARLEAKAKRLGVSYDDLAKKSASSAGNDIVTSTIRKLKNEILEIEHRNDITEEEKISRITHITCATCAGIAIQPIPFADIFILTPVQAYMGSRIAAIHGVPVTEAEVETTIKEVFGVIGMGYIAQQLAIALLKTVLPGFGGLTTIPLVYGLSFAIMRIIDAYYLAKSESRKLTPEEIMSLWKKAKAEGEHEGKRREKEINTDASR